MRQRKVVIDLEATNLLNNDSIDYSKMPYRLKDDFKVHCAVVKDAESNEVFCFYDGETYELDGRPYAEELPNGMTAILKDYEPVRYTHYQLSEFVDWIRDNVKMIIGHNIIDYDLLATALYFDTEYTIGPDTFAGKKCFIHDTLILSKLLNPDRFGGHSIANLGKGLGAEKIKFREGKEWDEDRFKYFAADMLYYCIRDVEVNLRVFNKLKQEWGQYDGWSLPYRLEKAVAEIITRQSHYGFKFDTELARWCAEDLKEKMDAIEARVEPRLPPKPMGKTAAKDYIPPKSQYKKSGELSSHMENFLKKHDGEVGDFRTEEVGVRVVKEIIVPETVVLYGKEHKLPLPEGEPVIKEEPMLLAHQSDIKQYLIKEMGWVPSNWKEKDLTIDTKKLKLNNQKFSEAVERYVEETLGSPYEKFRCEYLKCKPEGLKEKLLNHDGKKPLRVLTQPSYTIDQEKNLCEDLLRIGQQVDWVGDVVAWLTYRHRRNAILSENETGWLTDPRLEVDGRINTPADSLGCNTSRMQHKNVANIPRTSSLYGEYMRALFGVMDNQHEVGYDADGLEARIEGHYSLETAYKKKDQSKIERAIKYANALTAAKPHDLHTINAELMGVTRDDAKTLKYASSYGAQPPKIARQQGWPLNKAKKVFEDFWDASEPLKDHKEATEIEWEVNDKKFIYGVDGRKLMTRSKHSLLNTRFQAGGVICMKYAMVWLDRMLAKKGLLGNPFKEDVNARPCTVQMIAYHDEGQNMCDKSLTKQIKLFKDKEEASEWKTSKEKETGKMFSDVGKGVDGSYFVCYNPIGELAAKSITKAGEFFKLNVTLTAGYQVGKTWADCH